MQDGQCINGSAVAMGYCCVILDFQSEGGDRESLDLNPGVHKLHDRVAFMSLV
jgi:hypothetical protein